MSSLVRYHTMEIILASIILILCFILAFRVRTRNHIATHHPAGSTASGTHASSQVLTVSTVGYNSLHSEEMRHKLEDTGDLSGSLDGLLLPQVVQFFCSARESGLMLIHDNDRQYDELLFNDGQIIDARWGTIKGKQAAQTILQRRKGTFHFRRCSMVGQSRTIHEETMALLLEAHQIMDESRDHRH